MTIILTDNKINNIAQIMLLIDTENRKQINKYGIQSYPIEKWALVASEESGEVCKAILDFIYYQNEGENSHDIESYLNDIINEAIQAATCYIKIASMILEGV